MINQAKKMHHIEMEPLYWKIEDTIYKGDTGGAASLYVIALYAAKYNKSLISKGLRETHRIRLQQMAYELFDSSVPIKRESITIRQSISPVKIPFRREFELQEYLSSNPRILSEALGENVHITGTEVEVEADCEYRCDIVAESDDILYAIELKIGQTTHAVVSQCNKYCWYFYRKLRYNHYKDIQGIIIGNGFDEWSINEIRREGIWCYRIVPVENGDIKLEKIENG